MNSKSSLETEIQSFILRVQKLNRRTENKLKELRNILQEYHFFRDTKIKPLKQDTFQVIDLIQIADSYLNRKRLGKKTENDIFKELKDISLIRLSNTKWHFI